ncbi:MlaD family protein [Actinomadura chokoriensis]|uniref:MCE family protein n=1 Tax=Actinomadura chokoriensis TaxID=454156 RepID=A0ABV4QSU1_9ACTN
MIMAAVLAGTLAASGCSYQTAGSPQGGMRLAADFTDVQNLAVGHAVQINGVRIGTVTGIRLIGTGASSRVRVTMSLKKGLKVPQGTSAELSITSLLGENFVGLLPPRGGLDGGPFLPEGTVLASTRVVPAFEQVVGKAAPLLEAVSAGDVGTIVDAGAAAFGGRGEQLATMTGQVNDLVALFAAQRTRLDSAVTHFARLGRTLAANEKQLARLPGGLAEATRVLERNKDEMIDTLDKITDLVGAMDDTVLLGRLTEIRQMVRQLGPLLRTVAADNSNLGELIAKMENFVTRLPKGVFNGQLLTYPVLKPVVSKKAGGATGPPQAAQLITSLNRLMERRGA